MKFYLNNSQFIDTNLPLDISIPLSNTAENPRAWYVDLPIFEPVMENGFVGSVAKGGNVNFRNIYFNPHGHGTHTECLGHITPEVFSVNNSLKNYFFIAVCSWNTFSVCVGFHFGNKLLFTSNPDNLFRLFLYIIWRMV